MTFAVTSDLRLLEESVRSFLAARDSRRQARAAVESADQVLPTFWPELKSLGWLGLHLPAEHGGEGYGLPELAVVLAEMGRQLAPGPFLSTVLASALIDAAGSDVCKKELLPGLAEGSVIGGVALCNSLHWSSDGHVSGEAAAVLGGALADVFVLPLEEDLVVVPRSAAGMSVVPSDALDATRPMARVTLTSVPVAAERILVNGAETARRFTRSLLAAEAAGGALACLEAAVEYAKQRVQFGRTIGSFQAVKHICANTRVDVELAAATAWDAARAQAAARPGNREPELAAAVAAVDAAEAFVRAAQRNIQVHGGMGYTWEHDAHLFLRRALTIATLMRSTGDAPLEVLRLAQDGVKRTYAIDLPPGAEEFRAEARSFAQELEQIPASERRAALAKSGYLVPHWPTPWGRAAGPTEQLVIEEELAAVERPDLNISGWITLTVVQHGTEDQRARWVKPSLYGEIEWCQLFSEPEAGSDAAAIRTRAERVDGGWRVTGQKVWTSNAQRCQWGLATVRTDPDASKHAGVSMMAIDLSAPGVDIRPLRELTGEALFNEVFFDGVFVPDTDVVGGVNQGWSVARAAMSNERVSMGEGSGQGMRTSALLNVLAATSPTDLGEERAVGDLLAEAQAMRLISLRHAARIVGGDDLGAEGNITKLLAAEHAQRTSELAMRLAGIAGISGGAPELAHNYLFARCLTIGGGTSEIVRNQIAERVLGLPRDPLLA